MRLFSHFSHPVVAQTSDKGTTDDTTAINAAITDGTRCGFPTGCVSSTLTPALVYFPSGESQYSRVLVDDFTHVSFDRHLHCFEFSNSILLHKHGR